MTRQGTFSTSLCKCQIDSQATEKYVYDEKTVTEVNSTVTRKKKSTGVVPTFHRLFSRLGIL